VSYLDFHVPDESIPIRRPRASRHLAHRRSSVEQNPGVTKSGRKTEHRFCYSRAMNDESDDRVARGLVALVDVVQRLRRECPWHRAQTAITLSKYLIEESYETLAAIESGDQQSLRDELGDLLLQVLLQAELASETGAFGLTDVVDHAREKLIRRHPHVFAEDRAASAEEVAARWEENKRVERERAGFSSALDGIPDHLPALVRAEKLGERAKAAGMDWPGLRAVLAKVREEVDEAVAALEAGATDDVVAEELGDCLLALANAPRFVGWSVEETLRRACGKFTGRFKKVERRAAASQRQLSQLSAAEIDALWEEAKCDVRQQD
jgi:MazG family protein